MKTLLTEKHDMATVQTKVASTCSYEQRCSCTAQGIQGVRFKRLIMDESATDRSPRPPQEPDVKRAVFCSGKVRLCAVCHVGTAV